MQAFLERHFELTARGTTVGTEFRSAIATFLTMSYILFANPAILAAAGVPMDAAVVSTALAAGLCCLMMGWFANFPMALASGMGLNSLVAFQLAPTTGSWQTAMGLVVWDGVIIFLLVMAGVRESVMRALPRELRLATGAGIGLFIAFLGLINGRFVVVPPGTLTALMKNPASLVPPVSVGPLSSPETLIAAAGVILTAALISRRIKGSIVIGILFCTLLSVAKGIAPWPHHWEMPKFDLLFQANLKDAFRLKFLYLIVSLIMVDFFDTLGTVTAIGDQAGILDANGGTPRLRRILAIDALSASIGGLFGASSVTGYIESAAGVSEGARSGLHTLFVGLFFLLAIFAHPIAGMVPALATSPALILVGFLMISPIKSIDFEDLEVAIPAFLILITIPLTFSIAHGIGFGFITYTLIKIFSLKFREVHPVMYGVSLVFAIHFIWGG